MKSQFSRQLCTMPERSRLKNLIIGNCLCHSKSNPFEAVVMILQVSVYTKFTSWILYKVLVFYPILLFN